MKLSIFTSLSLLAVLLIPVASNGSYAFEDGNYWGYALETIYNMRDPQDCAGRCDQNPNCAVASFHSPFAPEGWAYKSASSIIATVRV